MLGPKGDVCWPSRHASELGCLKVQWSFCDNGSSEAESHNNIELALVVFNAHASCSCAFTLSYMLFSNLFILIAAWLLHQTDWTNDVNCFFKWLSAIIEFSADGFRHAAIAEGLAQALMFYHDKMCRSLNGSQNVGLQRHCILVAASNPDSRPPDAEKVAKSFPQSFVSLSVICPMQLPKLRAIYNTGKRNPSVAVADPNTEIVKHTQYVGLISKDLLLDMNMMVTSLPQTTVTSAEKLRITHKIWSRYVKVWEAYMIPSASKSLAKDWPSLIQIDRYSRDNTDSLKKQYVKRAYFVLFRAMHRHELLISLKKDKLCAVIKLPSQNLLLTVAGKPDRFMGMLFPVVTGKQQVASRQQQQQKVMAGTGMNQGSGGSTRSVDRGQVSSPGPTQ
ncbi:mediator of RNA polymerase II transcription subunit 25 isoform X2 [Tanacetum coccineum]